VEKVALKLISEDEHFTTHSDSIKCATHPDYRRLLASEEGHCFMK